MKGAQVIQDRMTDITTIYQERVTQFAETAVELRQKYNRYSIIRLSVFLAAAFLTIFLFTQINGLLGIAFLLIALFGFSRFIGWHRAILQQAQHHQFLSEINEEEIKALAHNYQQFGAGSKFIDPMHPNTVDMDIFGDYSIFQYANRTSTAIGKRALAQYLSTVATKKEILDRQKAIQELYPKLDWRQHFQATGRVTEDNIDHLQSLSDWLANEPFVSNNKWIKFARFFVPVWMLVGMSLSLYLLSGKVAIFFVLLPAFIIHRTLEKVNETHKSTSNAEKMLSFYANLIKRIEEENFAANKLSFLKAKFTVGGQKASTQIARLSYIIRQLNVRDNPFSILFNLASLWDLQYIHKLEKWKATNKNHLSEWFMALQEFEALNSLATLYYNNQDWTFPNITAKDNLEGIQLGHPLIHKDKRVANDFKTPTQAHIKLVTGSNMAGKSTFLRTVGVNIILAMAGSAVCAKELSLPILQVYSSMRTQDALHESTSSFYAELKRLKIIIEAVESSPNIYFLLDEILKGTNSKDRHTGSRALIEQMIKSKGAGIIATHDLELGDMEAQSAGAIENLCMEVAVENGKLRFDYTLEKGVSQSFNATILMKEMGINIG
ncbi:MAG: hypothetical protein AAGJ18_21160 [Bacteroidota bacterium]